MPPAYEPWQQAPAPRTCGSSLRTEGPPPAQLRGCSVRQVARSRSATLSQGGWEPEMRFAHAQDRCEAQGPDHPFTAGRSHRAGGADAPRPRIPAPPRSGVLSPTLARLAVLCDLNASSPLVKKAVGTDLFKKQAVLAWNNDPGAPVFLANSATFKDDVKQASPALLLGILDGIKKRKLKSNAGTLPELRNKLRDHKQLREAFQEAITQRISDSSLPREVAWVKTPRSLILFLRSSLPVVEAADASTAGDRSRPPAPVP